MNAASLGKTIAKLRKKNGMTQLQLASRINVSDKTVSKWENGNGFPEISILPVLSDVFGVTIDYLLKGEAHGIAVGGVINTDYINIIDNSHGGGSLRNILTSVSEVGGCVPNTSINLARIDPDIFLTALGKVRNDEGGRAILTQMRKYGIDTSQIKIENNYPSTGTSYIMSERGGGESTVFYYGGANRNFTDKDIDVSEMDCKILHMGSVMLLEGLDACDDQYGTKMAKLLDKVSKRGIKVSIDASGAENQAFVQKMLAVFPFCDYVIIDENEACRVTGLNARNEDKSLNTKNIEKSMKFILSKGVREKVIVHCREGGFLLNKDGESFRSGSLKVPDEYIKSKVGAGDAYAAGCLYGIYKEWDDNKILEFASATAICCLSESDSINGMRSYKEIEKVSKAYERENL